MYYEDMKIGTRQRSRFMARASVEWQQAIFEKSRRWASSAKTDIASNCCQTSWTGGKGKFKCKVACLLCLSHYYWCMAKTLKSILMFCIRLYYCNSSKASKSFVTATPKT
uniref:Uncharacterized protein n=1 Tax=Glossina austeni TaxID=7395 RepID=A0A1A9UFA1_GLOAU